MTDLKQSHFGSGYDAGRSRLVDRVTQLEADNQQLREENERIKANHNRPSWPST